MSLGTRTRQCCDVVVRSQFALCLSPPSSRARQLSEKLTLLTETLADRKQAHAELRARLLEEIAGPDVCTRAKCSFKHVPLRQLARMKVHAGSIGGADRVSFASLVATRAAKVSAPPGAAEGTGPVSRRPLASAASSTDDYGDEFEDTSQHSSGQQQRQQAGQDTGSESRIVVAEREIRRLKGCVSVDASVGDFGRCRCGLLFQLPGLLHLWRRPCS